MLNCESYYINNEGIAYAPRTINKGRLLTMWGEGGGRAEVQTR